MRVDTAELALRIEPDAAQLGAADLVVPGLEERGRVVAARAGGQPQLAEFLGHRLALVALQERARARLGDLVDVAAQAGQFDPAIQRMVAEVAEARGIEVAQFGRADCGVDLRQSRIG